MSTVYCVADVEYVDYNEAMQAVLERHPEAISDNLADLADFGSDGITEEER